MVDSFNFHVPKDMIVVVEGPDGSGKTPLADSLVKLGFIKHQGLFVPSFLACCDDIIVWDTPEQSYGEVMSVSNFKNAGNSVVMDRSVISWCVYNVIGSGECFLNDRMTDWNKILKRWKYSIVVCLMSDDKLMKENISKKTGVDTLNNSLEVRSEDYYYLYNFVDKDIRLEYFVEDYSKDWISDVIAKIFAKIQSNKF